LFATTNKESSSLIAMGPDELGFLAIALPVEGGPCVLATGIASLGVAPVTGTGAGAPPQACRTGSKTRILKVKIERNRSITLSLENPKP
jgi:hypothetical protein